jgi:hypothetical protein
VVDGGVVLAARESDGEGKKEGEGLSSADMGLWGWLCVVEAMRGKGAGMTV